MRVKLTTLSPIHIGGKEQNLIPMEYAIMGGKCYVISEEKLFAALQNRGLGQEFLDRLKREGGSFNLREFLNQRRLLEANFLEGVKQYSVQGSVNPTSGFRPFIRNAFSMPFIPGTAIKGVFRTSIMYVLLKRLDVAQRREVLDDFVRNRLREYRDDTRAQRGFRWFQENFKQWFAQNLDREIFQKFTLRSNQRRYDPHTDILRVIKISDSNSLERDSLRLEEIKIFSARSHESPKRWSIYAECMSENKSLEFEIHIDQSILSDFANLNQRTSYGMPFPLVAEIISKPIDAAKEMSQDLYQMERSFFEVDLNLPQAMRVSGNQPNFRLGWGGGLLGTSMGMLLPESLRQELRNTLFTNRDDAPAPKSRRAVARQGDKYLSLGWCHIDVH